MRILHFFTPTRGTCEIVHGSFVVLNTVKAHGECARGNVTLNEFATVVTDATMLCIWMWAELRIIPFPNLNLHRPSGSSRACDKQTNLDQSQVIKKVSLTFLWRRGRFFCLSWSDVPFTRGEVGAPDTWTIRIDVSAGRFIEGVPTTLIAPSQESCSNTWVKVGRKML